MSFEIGAMAVATRGVDLLVGSGPGLFSIGPAGDVTYVYPETAYQAAAMAAHGRYLYTIVGAGELSILDTASREAEPVVGTTELGLGQWARILRTDGKTAWVATDHIVRGNNRPMAEVIDVSDPANPVSVTVLDQPADLSSDARILDFDEGILYASVFAGGRRTLARWDVVQDVLEPVYSADIPDFALIIDVENPMLAVATGLRCSGLNGLTLVRENGAGAEMEEVFVTDERWSTEAVEIEGDHIFVLRANCGEPLSKLEVYRIADSEPTRLVGEIEVPGSAPMGGPLVEPVAIGSFLYVSEGEAGLNVIDVAEPEAPRLVATIAPYAFDALTADGRRVHGRLGYGILRQYLHLGYVPQLEASYRAYLPRALKEHQVGCPP